MSDPISVILPAHNEGATIASVTAYLRAQAIVDEVIVVDNNSTDDTAAVAAAAGARVVGEPRQGMGHAVRTGFGAARNPWVMKVDADLGRFQSELVSTLSNARRPGTGLIKGAWQDPRDDMPMTRLLVKPAVQALCPGLMHLDAPNSGIYLLNRDGIAHRELAGDYAVDIDAMMRVWAAGLEVREVNIGEIANDPRNPGHYAGMAGQIMRFFLARAGEQADQALLVCAPDTRAVIIGALGSIARRARAGGQVTVFLQDDSGDALLRAALGDFPTAQVRTLGEVTSFDPAPLVGQAQVIALADTGPVMAATKALHAQLGEHALPGLLVAAQSDADTALDVGNGGDIRDTAQAASGMATPGPAREMFRTVTPGF